MTQGIYEFGPCHSVMAYGGRSGNIEYRWGQHRSLLRNDKHYCIHLQRAWNKYGEDVFEFRVLEIIEDPDDRRAAEQVWLDIHHANKTCYNSAITAGPAGPMAEETKQKIATSLAGYKHPEEFGQAISERMMGNQHALGNKQSEEQRRATSERMMGKQYALGKQNALGYRHTDEDKLKIGSRIISEEERRGRSERMMGNQYAKGCTHSEEANRLKSERIVSDATRRRQSAAGKGRVVSPETRYKIGAAQMGELNHMWGKHPTEETLRKRSEAQKRRWARKRAMAGLSLPVLIPNPSRPMLLYGSYRK